VTLKPEGQLEYSDDRTRGILSGRVRMFGPEGTFLSYVNSSNGHFCASEI
jgi:hypothetical protein